MKKLKVLNLYAGIGGNRKEWENVEVTAIELNKSIAKAYQDFYSQDIVIVADAHEYLLDHFREFDFIWSSINCPSHSRARFWASKGGKHPPIYPDLKLYEEVLLLKHYFDGDWVVENIIPYYQPLIDPTIKLERHLFWSNFNINPIELDKNNVWDGNIGMWQKQFGIDVSKYKFTIRKDKVLRNCVHPKLGNHILNCARNIITKQNTSQIDLFENRDSK